MKINFVNCNIFYVSFVVSYYVSSSFGGDEKCSQTGREIPFILSHQEDRLQRILPDDSDPPILIWWYDDVFPHSKSKATREIKCPKGSCITSIDRSLKDNSSTRAFIFYGTSFMADDLPLPRKADHEWALLHEESPKNNWIFSHEEGISLFNYTATFRRESDYALATQFIVDPQEWIYSKFFIDTKEKNRLQKELGLAPAVYIQGNCEPPSDRDTYVRELMKYLQIDSYGLCLNNKEMPSNYKGFHKFQDSDFFRFLAQYKFHISFENAICKDYMTEKLFRPLQIGVVPVYHGSSTAKDFMPSDRSVILVDEFVNPKHLAEYLLYLNHNEAEYNKYLKHRQIGITNNVLLRELETRQWRVLGDWDKMNFGHRMYSGFECYVCDRVIEKNKRLKAHIKDGEMSSSLLTFGKQNHMGCPEPKSFPYTVDVRNKNVTYWQGLHEARALKKMLAGEKSSKNFVPLYLKIKTDKYS